MEAPSQPKSGGQQMSTTLPTDGATGPQREALRRLLMEQAFIRSREGEPLRDRRGLPTPWLFYGGEVTLSWRGLDLGASVLLDRLSSFSSTQIATYGISAIPLLAACVARGRYSGLVVRRERKAYGAARKIDGPIDRARSAVVIDESISSGFSAYEAICALEAEGVEVEGVVCLVEFTGYGAAEWLRGRGYRVETVFDVWSDLERPGVSDADEPDPADVPWSSNRAPSSRSPAELARIVVQTLSQTGLSPRPPESLDRDYSSGGGVFVSIRRRIDDVRIVRAGFRRNNQVPADLGLDVVLAAIEAFRTAPVGAFGQLDALKFAVSLLGPMEPIRVGEIDHSRHALVVLGLGPLARTGFALPNTPHFDDSLEQYQYARTVTASFSQLEPHALFRQRMERVVEPGASWPGYGAPRTDDDWIDRSNTAQALAVGLRNFLAEAWGEPHSTDLTVPDAEQGTHGVGVSLYRGGLAGCALSWSRNLDAALREATLGALRDERFGAALLHGPVDGIDAVVSLLLHPRSLGPMGAERLALFYRLGRDTLQASGEGRNGIVLAHFAVHQSLERAAYQAQVLEKAGLAQSAAHWKAYETASWLVSAGRWWRLNLGYPKKEDDLGRRDALFWRDLAEEIARFVVTKRAADGLPAYLYKPWDGTMVLRGTATRILIALAGVLEARDFIGADVVRQAEAMVGRFIGGTDVAHPRPGLVWDNASDAQLLNCLSLLADRDRHRFLALKVAGRLRRLCRKDGAIYAGVSRMPADLDFLSGSALLALARASDWLGESLRGVNLCATLNFYRRRFALSHPWGLVWWHAQAWSALSAGWPEARDFAFELVDWAIDRQTETDGAFVIEGLEPQRASFLTGCVLEAVAEAWNCARKAGDSKRAERYNRSWRLGAAFLERLTVRQNDGFFAVQPEAALGGVRATLVGSDLRIDFAGHALLALAKGLRAED